MQSKYKSWLESCSSTVTGFFISLLTWYLLGLSIQLSLVGTLILTIVSILRQYVFRRIFNQWV